MTTLGCRSARSSSASARTESDPLASQPRQLMRIGSPPQACMRTDAFVKAASGTAGSKDGSNPFIHCLHTLQALKDA